MVLKRLHGLHMSVCSRPAAPGAHQEVDVSCRLCAQLRRVTSLCWPSAMRHRSSVLNRAAHCCDVLSCDVPHGAVQVALATSLTLQTPTSTEPTRAAC
jgi:hypothetical protein